MKDNKKVTITTETTWKEITPGGIIYEAGNAQNYKTGEWRSMKPIWNSEKCKQCLLCFPVCPDSSILVEDGKLVGIDYDHCKGCGVCVEVCPFNVFDFVKEE
ncbi:4Fe-4S binding protein [Caloranaerobacter sp. DY30410]|uniref:4Fe-4S binding protein n=1 Tax=Caloranaerobacter sp. DY30410 TaxID=3238305 RepID=UPI003D08D991